MFIRAGAEAQQFSYGSVQAAERIRVIPFALYTQLAALPAPARAAAEVAGVVESQDSRFLKGRGEEGRGGVRLMMFDDDNLGVRKFAA